jgi:hypothetical protein
MYQQKVSAFFNIFICNLYRCKFYNKWIIFITTSKKSIIGIYRKYRHHKNKIVKFADLLLIVIVTKHLNLMCYIF